MTLVTIAGPDVYAGPAGEPRPYELGRVVPNELTPMQQRELGNRVGIPDALMPAEVQTPVVVDGYVERLEARQPGRVDEIQALEAEMNAFAEYRRKRGLWEPEPGTPYRDLQGNERRSVRWGDTVSRDRFMGDGGILDDEAVRAWASTVPSAISLVPLADPERVNVVVGKGKRKSEPVLAEATDNTREWMTACTDAWEIRNRGAILAQEFGEIIEQHVTEKPEEPITMVSVAAGTLLPTLQAAVNSGHDERIRIVMLENDPMSIAMAEQLSQDLGFRGKLDIREVDVFRPEQMEAQLKELEGQALTVDAVGIYEYVNENLRDSMSGKMGEDSLLFDPVAFFQTINRFTAEGGRLVLGQMRSDRPNGDFTSGVIGWPFIVRRSPGELMKIMVEGGADPENVKLSLTPIGVYTMASVRKPATPPATNGHKTSKGHETVTNGARIPLLGAAAVHIVRPAAPDWPNAAATPSLNYEQNGPVAKPFPVAAEATNPQETRGSRRWTTSLRAAVRTVAAHVSLVF